MYKIIGRWNNLVGVKAIHRWADGAREAAMARGKLIKAVARMCSKVMAQAFDGFREAVMTISHRRRLIRKVLAKIMNSVLLSTFQRLVDHVNYLHTRKKAILFSTRSVVTRWRNQSMFKGFHAWADWASEEARRRASMKQASSCAGCWPRRTYFGGTLAAPCPPTTGCRHAQEHASTPTTPVVAAPKATQDNENSKASPDRQVSSCHVSGQKSPGAAERPEGLSREEGEGDRPEIEDSASAGVTFGTEVEV